MLGGIQTGVLQAICGRYFCTLQRGRTPQIIFKLLLFLDIEISREKNQFISSVLAQTLLFDNPASSVEFNTFVLNATIQYILSTKRFEEALL